MKLDTQNDNLLENSCNDFDRISISDKSEVVNNICSGN
jgi:hypothetical protein